MLLPARGAPGGTRTRSGCRAAAGDAAGWLVSTTACARPPRVRSTAPASRCWTPSRRRACSRGDEWVFGPDTPYERIGDVDQVVFPCGWMLLEDGDTLRMYYGAADTSVCVATASLSRLLDWLEHHSS